MTEVSRRLRPSADNSPQPPANKAVANFFTPASKKEPERMTWRIVNDSLLVGRYNPSGLASIAKTTKPQKIAAFDFDSTLITSASGKKFANEATDWKWWHHSVPGTLRSLHEKGYLVAIVSNQGGISLRADSKALKSDQKRLAVFKSKVSTVLAQLDLPITLYAATSRDQYRKPRTGMWKELLEDYDLESAGSVDLEKSLFVGDAGGREAVAPKISKDHSCVDRDLASNIGIAFHTPEEYFLQEDVRPFVRAFEPARFLDTTVARASPDIANTPFARKNKLDIVLFCGSPGSGKSSYYWRHLQPLGYARVNQDILKTREKCLKSAAALVEEGTSVVVDNTNADPDTRALWVTLAKKFKIPIRCILFTASAQLCEHNDTVRALNIGHETNPESRTILPKLAFTGFASRYREPSTSEGFEDIIKVDFVFQGSEQQKQLWSRYWL